MWNVLKVYNKGTWTPSLTSFWCFHCWFWIYFIPFFWVSIMDFEQVNVSWASPYIITSIRFFRNFVYICFLEMSRMNIKMRYSKYNRPWHDCHDCNCIRSDEIINVLYPAGSHPRLFLQEKKNMSTVLKLFNA